MSLPDTQSSPSRPSLLPAFEPLSSSPGGLPRHGKRKFDEHIRDDRKYYPTPVPTSSTGILPSSPNAHSSRPKLHRSVSALEERAPLGAVPSLEIPSSGEPVHMGRSSNSSDYQLSSNRLISRVHVRATYQGPSEQNRDGEVIVECMGWNGCKIHYLGQVVELVKGEKFVSHKPLAQIMVDVQSTRVMLLWPQTRVDSSRTVSPCPPPSSPLKQGTTVQELLASSPPSMGPKLRSPSSMSPSNAANATFLSTFIASQELARDGQVRVYEDHESGDDIPREATPTPGNKVIAEDDVLDLTDPVDPPESTQSSTLSEPEELSEHDEENDPIVHSFGPFGDNLLHKFSSFKSVASPDHRRSPKIAKLSQSPAQPSLSEFASVSSRSFRQSPVKNHVINQLAYSRVHSIPLSTIFSNVPADMKIPKPSSGEDNHSESTWVAMSEKELRQLIDTIPCVGKIPREGKDAAGKPLEDEFYYLPDADQDEMRKDAVSGGRPPLRSVRKQHKQYYWKKPR